MRLSRIGADPHCAKALGSVFSCQSRNRLLQEHHIRTMIGEDHDERCLLAAHVCQADHLPSFGLRQLQDREMLKDGVAACARSAAFLVLLFEADGGFVQGRRQRQQTALTVEFIVVHYGQECLACTSAAMQCNALMFTDSTRQHRSRVHHFVVKVDSPTSLFRLDQA